MYKDYPLTYNPKDGLVTMPEELFAILYESHLVMEALQEHGVDNWEWYDEAMNSIKDIQLKVPEELE